tara:strand:- start:380 stop:580 length:201 start_codon:yes stop_codon:yes gene_type:complete
MIIRAKYPIVGNEYVGFQGYGSQGNRNSTIINEDTLRTLVNFSEPTLSDGNGNTIQDGINNQIITG